MADDGGVELTGLARFARVALLARPTPIERLNGLERALRARHPGRPIPAIHVKRDDLGPIGGGGNKLRKLEFLLGAAMAEGADTFLTTGARQSNHARLSAAAAARTGLACELFLTDSVDRQDAAYRDNGNVLLDALFGARVHRLPAGADALAAAQARAEALKATGQRGYAVGAGGSSPVGALGYADCAREIVAQERAAGIRHARIIVPNGSAGTHAGLAAGMAALGEPPARILSFAVLQTAPDAQAETLALARATLALLVPGATIAADDIVVDGRARGPGYGVPTAAMLAAVRLVAQAEGLLLDPVYSGKAFSGLIAMIAEGGFAEGEPVLFVMTGGVPGLFAYQPAFAGDEAGAGA